jgi:ribosomal protein S27AE
MLKQICPRCNEVGNAKHIDSYDECERCTLNDTQCKSKIKETLTNKK